MSLVAVTTVTTVGTAGSRLNDDVKESIVSGSVDSKNNSDDNVKVTNAMTGSLGESGPCTVNNQQSNNIENEQNKRDPMILTASTSMAVVTTVESNSSLDVKKETAVVNNNINFVSNKTNKEGISVSKSSMLEDVLGENKKNTNTATGTSCSKFTESQVEFMARLARERSEKKRLEEEKRVAEQKEGAALRFT